MSRLHLRAIRLSRIRRTAWMAASTLFVCMWIALFAQLASGHDPALTAKARARAVRATTAKTAQSAPPTDSSTQSSGQMAVVNPETGQLVDANTGAPIQIDPSTGQAIDPSTGVAVDPETGQALDNSAGSSSGDVQPQQDQQTQQDPQSQQSYQAPVPQPSYQAPAPMVTQQS